MENKLEIFNYKNIGSVRTSTLENGEPIFCLPDLCRLLDIRNSRNVLNRLREDGVYTIDTIDNLGRFQPLTFIDEPNVYEVIFNSRKPEAENIKWWVFNEVLPSLRRNGYYDMRNMSPAERTAFAIQCINEDLQEFKTHTNKSLYNVNERLDKHDKAFEKLKEDLNEEVAEMVAENKRIEDTVRIGFRTIEAFIAYLGISPDSIDKYDFAFDVETRCEELFLSYVDTNVPGFGRYKAYPFDIMMEVYEKKINN